MKSLLDLLEGYKVEKKQGDPLTDLIQEFQLELNKEAGFTYVKNGKKVKARKYTFAEVRSKLKHLNEDSLRTFLSMCKDYKNRTGSFRKIYHGALK